MGKIEHIALCFIALIFIFCVGVYSQKNSWPDENFGDAETLRLISESQYLKSGVDSGEVAVFGWTFIYLDSAGSEMREWTGNYIVDTSFYRCGSFGSSPSPFLNFARKN